MSMCPGMTPRSSTWAATFAATGSTGPVSRSHPRCPRRCRSKSSFLYVGNSDDAMTTFCRYVCDECRSAKENDEIYCLCRTPYDESQ